MSGPPHDISFTQATKVWVRIALLSFGGPAGQIAVMHRILVEEKKWIGEERFLHALNFCMLLPGPEAQQLATYIGWLLHRVKGGLVAGLLFILPGAIAIMALSWLYVLYGQAGPVAALFFGLKAAVLAIVFQAVVRIGKHALGNRFRFGLAAVAFAAIFFLNAPFPLVIFAAGVTGWIAGRSGSHALNGGGHGSIGGNVFSDADSALGSGIPDHARAAFWQTAGVASVLLVLWLTPVGLLLAFAPEDSVFAAIGSFFSQMAVLTFGGAYAVLAWVGQAAVEHYHWLSPREMLDGLGLAETTPGPLIMVTQYVGFLGAYRNPGDLPPLLAGTLGGLLTTWVTFTPCFLWIFLGAPFIERLRENRALASAMAAITAAVVGVILNLALWFALHFWFAQVEERAFGPIRLYLPDPASLDLLALALSAAAMAGMFWFRMSPFRLLGLCAVAGLLVRLV
ncbi:chromate efflux transporter [Rhizorhapis sp. SPR117]|uniref:chromate efflux transporter n=1 Tax=Rhizorhapis sp. SPR117 TaxID=2912611 RepID=UPI001F01E614|nr:chromate efflux transporter [Rhizorhapis sp. SPR117]